MELKRIVLAFLVLIYITYVQATDSDFVDSDQPFTAKTYIKLLRMRRRDHTALLERMIDGDYAKNYKLIEMALGRIFLVVKQSNTTLAENHYETSHGFPTEHPKQGAVTLLLENTCLAGDIILHFPEISYKILKKIPNWKETINWCIGFVNSFPHIIDEIIVELMDLLRQEINEDERGPDYINPYYKKQDTVEVAQKKKSKTPKKLKKGPQLTTKTEL